MPAKHEIAIILGTRPEVIKMAPVYRALQSISNISTRLAVVSQHAELLSSTLDVFQLKADDNIVINRTKGDLAQLTAQIVEAVDLYLQKHPSLKAVLVHGDTTTAYASALAAYYQHIPIIHIEAGLRTYNKYESFPEEMNRRAIATIADLHFAPSPRALANLKAEHVPAKNIYMVGNTVIDAMKWVLANHADPLNDKSHQLFPITRTPYVLVTAHRREQWGEKHASYFKALNTVAGQWKEGAFIFPAHPNPRVCEVAHAMFDSPNVHIIPAQDYLTFVYLMKHAKVIVTDSGGIQEEVTGLGIPTLTIRPATERLEAIECGTVKLTTPANLANDLLKLLKGKTKSAVAYPYGKGDSAAKISKIIKDWVR